jgi:phytoene dehydrogenase-like protein
MRGEMAELCKCAMVDTHYDVVVVGMQRAGLISAALLAKRGAKVLLVDHGEHTTTYRRKGMELPLLPTLFPALDDAPSIRKVHEELGAQGLLHDATCRLSPSFQAVMPLHRLDVFDDVDKVKREFRLEFSDLGDKIDDFFTELFRLNDEITEFLREGPPLLDCGILGRLRLRRSLKAKHDLTLSFEEHPIMTSIPTGHPLRTLLLEPLVFFGHLPSQKPTVFQAVRLLCRYFLGAINFSDELGGLSSLLLRLAEQRGVKVLRGAIVKGVELQGRRLRSLALEDTFEQIHADFFVAGCLGPFQDLLPPGKQQAKFTGEQQSGRAVGSLFTMNFVVAVEVIPQAMGAALLLLNGRQGPRQESPTDPPLLLRRYPLEHTDKDGKVTLDRRLVVLSVACPTRSADLQHAPDRLAALKKMVHHQMKRLIPFFDDYLVDVSLPMDTSLWDTDGQAGRINPTMLHPLFEHSQAPLFGVTGRTPRTYFKNLVHCGFDVAPGLGVEGEYITAIAAADILQRLKGRRWKHGSGAPL